MVNRENYEEYMILYADGELDTLGVQELKDFISKNPELYDELAMYQQLRMVPDVGIVHPDKEALLKKPATRIINLSAWQRYSAAAAILLLLCLAFYKYDQKPNDIKTAVIQPPRSKDTLNTIINKEQTIQKPLVATVDNKHTPTIAKPVIKKYVTNRTSGKREDSNLPVVIISNTNMHTLPVAQIIPSQKNEIASTITVPAISTSAQEKENSNLLAKLPLSPSRTEMLNDIKNSFAGRLDQIQNLANNIKDTRLVIRIGSKEINF